MLIDAGTNACEKDLISYIDSLGITKFDYIIATHAHEDHIGSMDAVINKYDVDKILFAKHTTTTKTFENFVMAVKNKENKLVAKIISTYGSIEEFFNEFKNKAKEVFGSGYTFLVLDNVNNLKLVNMKNQDTPLELNLKPLILIDLWEHAYYLKYRNLRDEYIDNFTRIINFDVANEVYLNNL